MPDAREAGPRSDVLDGQPRECTPDSRGEPPAARRLPASTRVGPVRLVIADLARSLGYYQTVLGLQLLERDATRALLGAPANDPDGHTPLVELREQPGAAPVPRRGRLGLYHFAILLPDRPSLGRFVRHLTELNVPAGAGDHLVSEAFYLQDPDNLGIEVYADRPREQWRRSGQELVMTTDPVDVADLLGSAGDRRWDGVPAGTVMGHVHLHVGDIGTAAAFYSDALGFDRTVWSYPGALFMSAGGYHHHLGTNVWAGSAARPPGERDARLVEWTIELPDAASVDAAAESLERAGHPVERVVDDLITHDPWGTRLRLRAGTTACAL